MYGTCGAQETDAEEERLVLLVLQFPEFVDGPLGYLLVVHSLVRHLVLVQRPSAERIEPVRLHVVVHDCVHSVCLHQLSASFRERVEHVSPVSVAVVFKSRFHLIPEVRGAFCPEVIQLARVVAVSVMEYLAADIRVVAVVLEVFRKHLVAFHHLVIIFPELCRGAVPSCRGTDEARTAEHFLMPLKLPVRNAHW